jgi:GAF domain-containing protein
VSDYPDNIVHAIRDLSRLMLSEEGLDAALARVVSLAHRSIPGCGAASMTMLQDGRFTTPVTTHDDAVKVDRAQYRADAGPCVQAVLDQKVVKLDDIAGNQRWPEFTEAATAVGYASSLSLPMAVEGEPVGALNLYGTTTEAFSNTDEQTALLFAEQAGVAALTAERYWKTYNVVQQLEEALRSRDVIGQAKGVLMAQRKITADDAFDLLRRASQHRNVKLRDLADEVASTGDLPAV